ncbi:SRD5A3.2 family protein [Megaselia abdita]
MLSFIGSLNINLIDFMFINFSLLIVFAGALINFLEPHLPLFITQSFRYGKHESKGEKNEFIRLLEVPKAWFKHFYVFALGWSVFALYLTIKGIILKSSAPDFVLDALDFLGGSSQRVVLLSSHETLIVLTLLTLQCVRRFYETNFVQIFSSKSKINVSHYLVGYLHYFGAIVAVLLNAEGFVRGTHGHSFSFRNLKVAQVICCMIFHMCWREQYKSNMIFVDLRKDKAGKQVTEEHRIPTGRLFNLVTSPHYLFEILIYVVIFFIIPQSSSWRYCTLWVISNQVENAWLTHKWYKETFKNYPKSRKAIIPFVF